MGLGGTSARITWLAGVQLLELSLPLQAKHPARAPITTVRWSRDRKVKNVVAAGTGANDAIVKIRYQPYTVQFTNMLKALIEDDEAGTFYPDFANNPTFFDIFTVVTPEEISLPQFAADYPAIIEYDFEMRIRKMDGTAWTHLFDDYL